MTTTARPILIIGERYNAAASRSQVTPERWFRILARLPAFHDPRVARSRLSASEKKLALVLPDEIDLTSVVSLNLTPVPANGSGIPIDGTQDYKLTGNYSDGTTQVLVNSQAQWSSADVTIAIVSPSGVATPISAGTTTIKAQYGGMSATASLIVQ